MEPNQNQLTVQIVHQLVQRVADGAVPVLLQYSVHLGLDLP